MTTATHERLRQILDSSPMTRTQVFVISVAVLLATLDGYDVLGMAFAAPSISLAWGLNKAVLGFLLATSLIGMATGSLLLSPLADILGRRPMALAGVFVMILGSGLSALAHGVPQLALFRILTGIGIGTVVPLSNAIAVEFASAKGRAFAVTCISVGFTVGSVVGSLVAAALLRTFAWPAVFVSGAIVGLVVLPMVAFGLPESPSFLVARVHADALERLNRVLKRVGRPQLDSLDPAQTKPRLSYKALFAPATAVMTACFAGVMILVSATTYFLLNWLPQIITDAGFSPSTGSIASAASSTMGIVSGLAFGFAATRFGPVRLGAIAMIGLGCAVAIFGLTPPKLSLLLISVAICGFFSGGSAAMFYATIAASFPPHMRVSGIGFVTGIARIFSVGGPAVAGILFAHGLSRSGVSLVFSTLPVLAGFLLVVGARRAARLSTKPAHI